jgi:hypothetical protein
MRVTLSEATPASARGTLSAKLELRATRRNTLETLTAQKEIA